MSAGGKCELCKGRKLRKGGSLEAVYDMSGLAKAEGITGVRFHVSCLTGAVARRRRAAERRGLATSGALRDDEL